MARPKKYHCPYSKEELQHIYDKYRTAKAAGEAMGVKPWSRMLTWLREAGIQIRQGPPRKHERDPALELVPDVEPRGFGECSHSERFNYGEDPVEGVDVQVCADCGKVFKLENAQNAQI